MEGWPIRNTIVWDSGFVHTSASASTASVPLYHGVAIIDIVLETKAVCHQNVNGVHLTLILNQSYSYATVPGLMKTYLATKQDEK